MHCSEPRYPSDLKPLFRRTPLVCISEHDHHAIIPYTSGYAHHVSVSFDDHILSSHPLVNQHPAALAAISSQRMTRPRGHCRKDSKYGQRIIPLTITITFPVLQIPIAITLSIKQVERTPNMRTQTGQPRGVPGIPRIACMPVHHLTRCQRSRGKVLLGPSGIQPERERCGQRDDLEVGRFGSMSGGRRVSISR